MSPNNLNLKAAAEEKAAKVTELRNARNLSREYELERQTAGEVVVVSTCAFLTEVESDFL